MGQTTLEGALAAVITREPGSKHQLGGEDPSVLKYPEHVERRVGCQRHAGSRDPWTPGCSEKFAPQVVPIPSRVYLRAVGCGGEQSFAVGTP